MRCIPLALGALVACQAQAQVFTDDFELWESNMPYYWTGPQSICPADSVEMVTGDVHGGNFALRLLNRSVNAPILATQPVHLDSGVTYLFEYWVRGQGAIWATFYDGWTNYPATLMEVDTTEWLMLSQVLPCQRTTDVGAFFLLAVSTIALEHILIDDFSVSEFEVPQPPLHTIQEIQTPAAGSEESSFIDSVLAIQGIITAWDQNFASFFVQQGTGPYSGIWVYSSPIGFDIGDEVRVTGKVEEYEGPGGLWSWTGSVTRMIDVSDRILISEDNILPAPEPLSVNDALLEEWEGVLVRVDNLQWTGSPVVVQGWLGTDGQDTVRVHDFCYTTMPLPDVTYSMSGVMHYWDGERKLEPRGPYDQVVVGVPEEARPRVRIYPNPASDLIRVELPETSENVTYTIHDAMGRIVQSGRLKGSAIVLDVSGIAPGNYWTVFDVGKRSYFAELGINPL